MQGYQRECGRCGAEFVLCRPCDRRDRYCSDLCAAEARAELFGASATASAIDEVMRTGHVGADYVEYVMRHKRRLVPSPAPLRLGKPELDDIHVTEPDLATYDDIYAHPTRDPGEPLTETDG